MGDLQSSSLLESDSRFCTLSAGQRPPDAIRELGTRWEEGTGTRVESEVLTVTENFIAAGVALVKRIKFSFKRV